MNLPPPPPLQPAKGRRKTSSRLLPNHLTCLDAFSSPKEGTGFFFNSSFCKRCLQRADQTPLFPVSCRCLCSRTSECHMGKARLGPVENKTRLVDGVSIHPFIHSFIHRVPTLMYKEIDQTPYKQEINTKNLTQCWKECMATSSYTLRKAAVEKFNSENYWKKKGLAMVPLKYPIGLGSVAAGQVSSSNRQIQKR